MRLLSVFLGVVAVAMWGCDSTKEDESAKKQFEAIAAVHIGGSTATEEQKKLIEEAAKLKEDEFVKKFAGMIKAKYMDNEENFKKILAELAPKDKTAFESMKDDAAKNTQAQALAKLLHAKIQPAQAGKVAKKGKGDGKNGQQDGEEEEE